MPTTWLGWPGTETETSESAAPPGVVGLGRRRRAGVGHAGRDRRRRRPAPRRAVPPGRGRCRGGRGRGRDEARRAEEQRGGREAHPSHASPHPRRTVASRSASIPCRQVRGDSTEPDACRCCGTRGPAAPDVGPARQRTRLGGRPRRAGPPRRPRPSSARRRAGRTRGRRGRSCRHRPASRDPAARATLRREWRWAGSGPGPRRVVGTSRGRRAPVAAPVARRAARASRCPAASRRSAATGRRPGRPRRTPPARAAPARRPGGTHPCRRPAPAVPAAPRWRRPRARRRARP